LEAHLNSYSQTISGSTVVMALYIEVRLLSSPRRLCLHLFVCLFVCLFAG